MTPFDIVPTLVGMALIAGGVFVLCLMLKLPARRGGVVKEGWPGPRSEGCEAPDGAPSGAGSSSAPGACDRHAAPGADLTRPAMTEEYVFGAFAGIIALNFQHLTKGGES
jgi:hypothetical protein